MDAPLSLSSPPPPSLPSPTLKSSHSCSGLTLWSAGGCWLARGALALALRRTGTRTSWAAVMLPEAAEPPEAARLPEAAKPSMATELLEAITALEA